MSQLDTFADSVATELYGPNKVIDPSVFELIKLLAEIIVPIVKDCMEARQARLAAGNPTPLQKVWLNAKVRQEMGQRNFRENNGRQLVNAGLKSFSNLSVEEIQDLYDTV